MRTYEMMAIFHPQLADEDLSGAIDQVAGYVTNAGGEVTGTARENPWGRRRLAYPIRVNGQDVRDGFYVLYNFNVDARRITDLERSLKLNDRVIRHIIVKPDEE
ncbi:MAG: 30S ribosomal protein S6 [Chloroflexota bacterium]|nr:30S ribosomal protein S6 [Chloroflexota bacterium]